MRLHDVVHNDVVTDGIQKPFRGYPARRNQYFRSLQRPGSLVLVLALLLFTGAHADSVRCGRRVVHTGDTLELLRSRCGEPNGRDHAVEQFWLDGVLQKVRVERWYYKPGNRKLGRVILVYRGKVIGIRTGGR